MEGKRSVIFADPFDEEDGGGDDELLQLRSQGMRKMTKEEQKKFPNIVADSMRCKLFHIARTEKCNGCNLAIDGCEKVFQMSAG